MAKIYTEAQLNDFHDRALSYPNVESPDVFRRSYMLHVNRGRKTKQIHDLVPETITVQREPWQPGDDTKGYEQLIDKQGHATRGIRLHGALASVPAYKISGLDSTGRVRTLRNRVAIMAYGSNSSSDVLSKKFIIQIQSAFRRAASGAFWNLPKRLNMMVVSGTIKDHVIAAGAFAGAIGSNPATILKNEGTDSTITVGFFDKAAAEQMVTTEPNYDASAINAQITLANGMSFDSAIVWNSPWGARSDPQNQGKPVAYSDIPSNTALRKVNGEQALNEVIKAATGEDVAAMPPVKADIMRRTFIRRCILGVDGDLGIAVNDGGETFRLNAIEKLQQNRIAPNIDCQLLIRASFPSGNARAREILAAVFTREMPGLKTVAPNQGAARKRPI